MEYKMLIPCLYLEKGQAVTGFGQKEIFGNGDPVMLSKAYGNSGADAVLIFDFSSNDAEHEETIGIIKRIAGEAEIPVIGAGHVKRLEDVKKLLYAGCEQVILNFSKEDNVQLLEEASKRFGKEKLLVSIFQEAEYFRHQELIEAYAGGVLYQDCCSKKLLEQTALPVYFHSTVAQKAQVLECLTSASIAGISGTYVSDLSVDHMQLKKELCKKGISMNTFESKIPWEAFKLNREGLIPVIVQDYKTDEVLMLAYMNEEAFQTTLETGRMTYWSRSREELWTKGMTSGHFQYVKSLTLDCDKDTILAKVSQVGPACHTGSRSCFFQELMKKPYDDTNPLHVFQEVFDVILDRKQHPKEGSYTNYLFEKGIDKILKKVGEECTEIVIAAKNPDKEEIKYEISDFLYHVMVLMAEKEVTWEEITRELARR